MIGIRSVAGQLPRSRSTISGMALLLVTLLLCTSMQKVTHMPNEELVAAAGRGETATVMQLLHDGAAINWRDGRGRTAVMAATHGNHPETVQALIQAGADLSIADKLQDTPFLYAGAEGLLEILKLTLVAGADVTQTNRYGGTALIPACERGHVAIVTELLTNSKINVNHINKLGWTALLEAIVLSNGGVKHQQIVQLLVDHGADITIADKDGVTPLAHARKRGFSAIVQILERTEARRHGPARSSAR